jgi:glyoxylase-like metal-dependent hydrolase (beta-lactamase superfamily II)
MNLLEQQLGYPLGDTLPATGSVLDIAPGVRWLRMPLPFALDHINLWLLRDTLDGREGWTVVDCGVANDATRAAWEQVFAQHLDGLPVLRVIVTHMHPDHIGLAHWLTERWRTPEHECRLWISATDFNAARIACQSTTGFGGETAASFMASHGLSDPEALSKVRARGSYFSSMVPELPTRFARLMDGQTLQIGGRTWRCLAGHGHAPEHISLFREAGPDAGPDADPGADIDPPVMISGDMVLPRISTNISVIDLEPEADPLALYLASLARLRVLPADTRVLPSHGRPFTGLQTRIDQLDAHHEERLAEVLTACGDAPQHAADILKVMFRRPLDLHQTTFAMGESIAHLNALWLSGRLHRERDADGVWRFARA